MQFRLWGSRWTHVERPRHTALLPWRVLARELAEEGFRPVLVTTTDRGSLAYDSFGWSMSLAHLVRWRPASEVLRQAGRVIARLARPIERRGRRADCYTAVFQRTGAQ